MELHVGMLLKRYDEKANTIYKLEMGLHFIGIANAIKIARERDPYLGGILSVLWKLIPLVRALKQKTNIINANKTRAANIKAHKSNKSHRTVIATRLYIYL